MGSAATTANSNATGDRSADCCRNSTETMRRTGIKQPELHIAHGFIAQRALATRPLEALSRQSPHRQHAQHSHALTPSSSHNNTQSHTCTTESRIALTLALSVADGSVSSMNTFGPFTGDGPNAHSERVASLSHSYLDCRMLAASFGSRLNCGRQGLHIRLRDVTSAASAANLSAYVDFAILNVLSQSLLQRLCDDCQLVLLVGGLREALQR